MLLGGWGQRLRAHGQVSCRAGGQLGKGGDPAGSGPRSDGHHSLAQAHAAPLAVPVLRAEKVSASLTPTFPTGLKSQQDVGGAPLRCLLEGE